MNPIAAVVAFESAVRVVIIHDTASGSIPLQTAAELHGEVGQNAAGRRNMPLFDIRHRPLLIATRREEIFEVPSRGRRGEELGFFSTKR